ncbi:hypothetical protein, partial [Escherichia coli]|uniref:hypothetical protein n=1 Tax=Escherichia coli TaxID=562 RepID=UPI00235006F3
LVYCKMSVGSTHHLEMVFVWKQNYILVDEYFFFCCTWIVNSAFNEGDLLRHTDSTARNEQLSYAVKSGLSAQAISEI